MGEPDPAEEVIDGYDCFAADDDERIAGLDMRVEGKRPPFHILEEWDRDAKYDPLPPGVE